MALHDIVNGFPSPKFSKLDDALKRMDARGRNFRLLRQRYRRARVRLRIDAHTYCQWQIGCGTAQGDGISPELFQEAYFPAVDQWGKQMQLTPGGKAMNTTDPITNTRINTSLTTYADDLGRFMLFSTLDSYKEQHHQNDRTLEKT